MAGAKGEYFLAIEPILGTSQGNDANFLAYFVGSTAPNNVEDGVAEVDNPEPRLRAIAKFLADQPGEREILIVVHGYNTSLGSFTYSASGETDTTPTGVKGWYESIKNHIADCYFNRAKKTDVITENIKPKGLVLLGYRWSSEVINGLENDSLWSKINYAARSLPELLKALIIVAGFGIPLSIIALLTIPQITLILKIILLAILTLTLAIAFIVLTLFLLRLSGYFRDSYRANSYGVPDLVELLRQLDNYIVEETSVATESDSEQPRIAKENYWKAETTQRIKLSFIGHSMGGFVVTNTVRILSDVFDQESVGNFNVEHKTKSPSSRIGHVFSLGRLVLVSPDISAESIVSGRANFLSSSLRRFEEAYLFSNEGDMALRLASTAANYFSFPAKTRAGGYRLGNVVVGEERYRAKPKSDSQETSRKRVKKSVTSGVVNLNDQGQLAGVNPRKSTEGDRGFETTKRSVTIKTEKESVTVQVSTFLDYLFILPDQPLSIRQAELLYSDQKPIAELFTFFDCTDYHEIYPERLNGQLKKMGVLTHALGKFFLSPLDHVRLAIDFASGRIDTHGGYFNDGDETDPHKARAAWTKPEARLTKQLIYGLACLGFKDLLTAIAHEYTTGNVEAASYYAVGGSGAIASNIAEYRKQTLLSFSALCKARGIQVLLAPERYNRDILGIWNDDDRIGY
jgi:hypothetical protein